ncbi:hypothetical protein DYB35_001844 [Aphanomyces astaci]|uniref:Methyltransferase domain-containing protein n=2 Tax=Aphanomyces astaci TaxID=112090 RepID=A0A3R6WGV7_APHAT|nr:hypothetical protein DYB35_001844 [Aphanomyces astaci]
MTLSWTRQDLIDGKHLHLKKNVSLCETWIQTTFCRLPLDMQRDFIDPEAYEARRRVAAARVASTKAAKDFGQFFSPDSSIDILLDIVFAIPIPVSSALFLEPSCGNGNFFRPLVERGAKRILAYELDPSVAAVASAVDVPGTHIICGDFLTSTKPDSDDVIVVVGTPPFSSSLHDDVILSFFQHCVDTWQPAVIAFILPDRCAKPAYVEAIEVTLSRGGYVIHRPIVAIPDSHFDFHGRRINKPSVVLVCVTQSCSSTWVDVGHPSKEPICCDTAGAGGPCYSYMRELHTLTTGQVCMHRRALTRLTLYFLVMTFRTLVLYVFFNRIERALFPRPATCWYADLRRDHKCIDGFDHADHIVLYMVHFVSISCFEWKALGMEATHPLKRILLRVWLVAVITVACYGIYHTAHSFHSMLLRFTEDTFDDHLQSTIGVDFKVKMITVDGKRIKMTIWDTAGQERFRTLTSSTHSLIVVVHAVYDVARRDTFANLDTWLQEVEVYSPANGRDVVKLLVGNKIDKERAVSRREGEAWARSKGMLFVESSAKTKTGIQQVFNEVVQKVPTHPIALFLHCQKHGETLS